MRGPFRLNPAGSACAFDELYRVHGRQKLHKLSVDLGGRFVMHPVSDTLEFDAADETG
jgi:hypothetical protein